MARNSSAPVRAVPGGTRPQPQRRGGQSVLKAAGIMAAVSVCTRIVSALRETAVAAKFGAGGITDIFVNAMSIPTVVAVVAAGALTIALVPILTRRQETDGPDGLARLAGSVTGLLALVGAALAGVLWLFATPIMGLTAPGFAPEQVAAAASLLRVMAPLPFFLGISAALTATLYVCGEFAAPALGQFSYSVAVVAVLLVLAAPLGIAGGAWGYVVAGAVQVLVLLVGLALVRQPLRLGLWDPDLKEVGRLALPVLISAGAMQLGNVLVRSLGSFLAAGGSTYLVNATRVGQIPITIFSAAIVTAVYAKLSAVAPDSAGFKGALQQGLRLCLFVITPLAAGALLFRHDVVALLFERGKFGHQEALVTAAALGAMAPGIVALSVWDLAQRAFFARRDWLPPVVVAVISVVATVGLGLALLEPLGTLGLGLAVSGGQIVSALALLAWLQARSGALRGAGLGAWVLRLALAAGAAAAVGVAGHWVLALAVPGAGKLAQIIRLGGAGSLLLGAYALAGFALGLPEVRLAVGKVTRRLRR